MVDPTIRGILFHLAYRVRKTRQFEKNLMKHERPAVDIAAATGAKREALNSYMTAKQFAFSTVLNQPESRDFPVINAFQRPSLHGG